LAFNFNISVLFRFLANPDIYFGKETFMPSGYGFAMVKGSPMKKQVDTL